MSHNLYAIVVRTKDLTAAQAERFRSTAHEDFMIASTDVGDELRLTMPRVQLSTDYFGGAGEQTATYLDEKGPHTSFGDSTRGGAINAALKLLGVPPTTGMDLFDVIGLGRIRKNRDLCVPTVTLTLDNHKELLSTLEDLKNWRSIIRLRAGETLPPNEFTAQDMEEMETLAGVALTIARKGVLTPEE